MQHIFKNDITISEFSIDLLYFSLISTILEEYNKVINTIEIAITAFQAESLYNPSREISLKLEYLSRITDSIKDGLLNLKKIFTEVLSVEKEKEVITYLRIVCSNIKELIDLVEIHNKSLASIIELYNSYKLFYKLI